MLVRARTRISRLFVLTIATATVGCASMEVHHDVQPGMEGVLYRLPRGVLLVNVPITRTVFTATPLTNYAMVTTDDFAGLPVIELPEEWAERSDIADKERLFTFGHEAPTLDNAVEPDPEQAYFIRIRGDATQNRTLKLALNTMGVLTDGESHVQDKKLELILASIEAAARIGGSFVGLRAERAMAATLGRGAAYVEAVKLRRELLDLSQQRQQWVVDQKPKTAEALRIAMAAFDAKEAAIADRFVLVNQKAYAAAFEIRPWTDRSISGDRRADLVTIDRAKGVTQWIKGVQKEITGPDELSPDIEEPAQSGIGTQIRIDIRQNSAYALKVKSSQTVKSPSGFVYRIPGAVNVALASISDGRLKKAYVAKTVQLPQAGSVVALPRHAGLSPENHVTLALYEETGSLKSLNVESKAVDPKHYAGWSGPLVACEADARDMGQIASSQGFKTKALLSDKAKREAVLTNLAQAAQSLASGDVFFLSYSGHGGQLPDANADEFDDGQDETWCLFDGQPVDDELYTAFGKFKQGVRIIMLSDSCHSGTVAKLMLTNPINAIRMDEGGAAIKCMSPMAAFRTYDANRKFYDPILANSKLRDAWLTVEASVVLISACQDSQTALDGTFNGLFTGTLLRIWNRGAFEGGYRNFFDAIARRSPAAHMPNYFKTGQPMVGVDAMQPFKI